jgi:hypothetical protein
MLPSARKASRIASARPDSVAGSVDDKYPSRATFFVCCASAVTATASCTATTKIDKRAAFFIAYIVLGQAYHARGNCGKKLFTVGEENVTSRGKRLIST